MSKLFGIFDENLILTIMSWLDLRDYGLLDLALTNVVERKLWMIGLSSAHLYSNLRTTRCPHSLLLWLIKRKMQPEIIRCAGSCVLDDLSFAGIDNKLLHTLAFSFSELTDAGLLMIAQGCPQLKDITLGRYIKISDEGLLALAVNLPGMTSIDLCLTSDVTYVGVTAMVERCPALVKISITGGCRSPSSSVTINDSIRAIARGCPKLQAISISSVIELSDESAAFLAERCKELRSVCLRGCDLVTDEAIKAIATSCPDLEKLDLGGRPSHESFNNQITDESFIIVGQKCPKLVDISITNNIVTNIGLAALARGCLQLRSFSANDCPSISTDGMMALSHGCKELRTIYLHDCNRITDDSLFRIAKGCLELTSFTLSRSNPRSNPICSSSGFDTSNPDHDAVTNAGISCIARGCKKLTSITIDYCRRIDDTALIAIGSSCPNLRTLIVFGTSPDLRTLDSKIESVRPEFSNRGLIAIARGCPALESITMSAGLNITDASVIVLAKKCLQLKSITLDFSKISDASLIAFATNSRKLQNVSFCYCNYITPIGLSILAAECAQMQEMDIGSCKKVGTENLLSLRRKYLRLKTSEHIHPETSEHIHSETSEHIQPTSLLSMLRYYFSCK